MLDGRLFFFFLGELGKRVSDSQGVGAEAFVTLWLLSVCNPYLPLRGQTLDCMSLVLPLPLELQKPDLFSHSEKRLQNEHTSEAHITIFLTVPEV